MRAVTVVPGQPASVELTDMPEPPETDGAVLVETLAIGVCGTDLEIIRGEYGTAPPDEELLIIGHESLGRVVSAPDGSGVAPGDHVVGIVRRRDPVPCAACAAGDWDMCLNGGYTERGIKGRHGFASERFRTDPEHIVTVDRELADLAVLLEPATVVAKAWEHIEVIGRRSTWAPAKVLVTGAGPIGLLAALLARQRGFDTHVFDRTEDGIKPAMVAGLGATYHHGAIGEALAGADVVIECTGYPELLLDPGGDEVANRIVCLTGVSDPGPLATVDVGAANRRMVLQNSIVFGTVNANRRHYQLGAAALATADPGWLAGLISRRVDLDRFDEAYRRDPGEIKNVLTFAH
jgi:threonine dehydrogenase-like Zn-dependent dehydrogenase